MMGAKSTTTSNHPSTPGEKEDQQNNDIYNANQKARTLACLILTARELKQMHLWMLYLCYVYSMLLSKAQNYLR